MPDEYRIVLQPAYDDLGLFESWSLETNYLHARAFLETLVGGPHRVAHTRYGDMDEYDIAPDDRLGDMRGMREPGYRGVRPGYARFRP